MTTAQRRTDILQILKKADAPIAAKELAAHFGVSRQVIVQDMAVIRVSVPGILSTTRGYVLQQDSGSAREFKVCHTPEQAADEGRSRGKQPAPTQQQNTAVEKYLKW